MALSRPSGIRRQVSSSGNTVTVECLNLAGRAMARRSVLARGDDSADDDDDDLAEPLTTRESLKRRYVMRMERTVRNGEGVVIHRENDVEPRLVSVTDPTLGFHLRNALKKYDFPAGSTWRITEKHGDTGETEELFVTVVDIIKDFRSPRRFFTLQYLARLAVLAARGVVRLARVTMMRVRRKFVTGWRRRWSSLAAFVKRRRWWGKRLARVGTTSAEDANSLLVSEPNEESLTMSDSNTKCVTLTISLDGETNVACTYTLFPDTGFKDVLRLAETFTAFVASGGRSVYQEQARQQQQQQKHELFALSSRGGVDTNTVARPLHSTSFGVFGAAFSFPFSIPTSEDAPLENRVTTPLLLGVRDVKAGLLLFNPAVASLVILTPNTTLAEFHAIARGLRSLSPRAVFPSRKSKDQSLAREARRVAEIDWDSLAHEMDEDREEEEEADGEFDFDTGAWRVVGKLVSSSKADLYSCLNCCSGVVDVVGIEVL